MLGGGDTMLRSSHGLCSLVLLALLGVPVRGQETDNSKAAQEFRKGNQTVPALSPTTIVAEAEEFRTVKPGWQTKPFGTNYYAATFANAFISRKAYLGA